MENKQTEALIMDEIIIEELQEISGGKALITLPPRTGGIVRMPDYPFNILINKMN